MSRRKKKLYARKHQPWYAKKAAIAQAMEDALTAPPEAKRSPTGGDMTLRAGTATAASTTGNKLVLDSVSAATADKLIYTLEERLGRVKEGMKRWHKAVRRSDSRQAGMKVRKRTRN